MRLPGDGSQVLPGTGSRRPARGGSQCWEGIVLDEDRGKESEKGYQEDDEAEVGAQCSLFRFSFYAPVVELKRHDGCITC